jgi:hypothetical protein
MQIGVDRGTQSSSEHCVICQYLRSLRTSLDPAVAPVSSLHPTVLISPVQPLVLESTPAAPIPGRAPPTA